MTQIQLQESQLQETQPVEAHDAADDQVEAVLLEADLIEEISIDGMCGVY